MIKKLDAQMNALKVNKDDSKKSEGRANITKFGPIGKVGNFQIGGFGSSLKASQPSQPVVTVPQNNSGATQF